LVATRRLEEIAPDPELVQNSPFITLAVLGREGPQRPTELQDRTGLSSGGMTKALQRLEDVGLLHREPGADPDDGRVVEVSLTPSGHRTLRQIGEAFTAQPDATGFSRQAQRVVAAMADVLGEATAADPC
jgi:DNA-binding MarR family transcriptional regulator